MIIKPSYQLENFGRFFDRLWVLWCCYWNDVCPRHGAKSYAGLVRGHVYCPKCNAEKAIAWREKQARLWREAQK